MRAAPGEPRRGQIPVVQDANCRLNVSRRSGVLRTNGDRMIKKLTRAFDAFDNYRSHLALVLH